MAETKFEIDPTKVPKPTSAPRPWLKKEEPVAEPVVETTVEETTEEKPKKSKKKAKPE